MGTGTRYVRICDQCFEAGLMDTISGAVDIQASVVDLDTRILGTGAGVLGIKAGFVRTSARAVRVPVGAMGFKGGIISTDAGTRKHGLVDFEEGFICAGAGNTCTSILGFETRVMSASNGDVCICTGNVGPEARGQSQHSRSARGHSPRREERGARPKASGEARGQRLNA